MKDEKQQKKKVQRKGSTGSGILPKPSGLLVPWMLALIPLVAALFYGVVGEDKFLLLSPLIFVGYLGLAIWLVHALFRPRTVVVAPPAFFLFVVFTVFGTVLIAYTSIPYEAKIRMLLLGLLVGVFFLWSNTFIRFKKSRIVLSVVLVFLFLGCFYGLVNHFKNPDQVLWVTRYAPYPGRLASTYICPNHFAHLLQMLLPFCVALLFIPQAGWILRILSGYCIVVFIPTLYFTESRAGMLGSIAAIGVTTCLLALRKSRKLFLFIIIVVPLLATLLLAGAWNYSEMFKRRMTPVVEFLTQAKEDGVANTQTKDFRPLTWLDSIDMIKEKPLCGFGPGSYRYTFPEHRKRCGAARVVTGHPHNEFLEVASEYGLIGFGLLTLAWGWGLVRLLIFSMRATNQHHAFIAMAFLGTAAGTLLHSFFDFQMHVFPNMLLFTLLAAIAAGPFCGWRQGVLFQKGRSGRPLLAILVVASLAGLFFAGQTFSSAFLRAYADRMVEQAPQQPETLLKAEGLYITALKIDSKNWQAYKGLGLIYHKQRYYALDLEEKREWVKMEYEMMAQGYRYNPKSPELAVGFGRAALFAGKTEEGLELLRQAVRLRPFNDNYWQELGIAERKAGEYEAALETFRQAQTIRNTPPIRKNIQWIEAQLRTGGQKPKEAKPSADLKEPSAEKNRELIRPLIELKAEPDPDLMNLLKRMEQSER